MNPNYGLYIPESTSHTNNLPAERTISAISEWQDTILINTQIYANDIREFDTHVVFQLATKHTHAHTNVLHISLHLVTPSNPLQQSHFLAKNIFCNLHRRTATTHVYLTIIFVIDIHPGVHIPVKHMQVQST